jgi:hypothetical protein
MATPNDKTTNAPVPGTKGLETESTLLDKINIKLKEYNDQIEKRTVLLNKAAADHNTGDEERWSREIHILSEDKKGLEALDSQVAIHTVGIKVATAEYSKFATGVGNAGKAGANAFQQMISGIREVLKDLGPLGKLMGASGPFMAAKGFQYVTEKIDSLPGHILEAQTALYDFQKSIESMGVGFGKSFDEAINGMEKYRQGYTQTMRFTKASKETMKEVQGAFKNMIDPTTQIESLEKLGNKMTGLKGPLSVTSAAILAGAATGTDAAEVTKWMAKSMTELNTTAEDAALSLGKIGWAAKNSGLQFGVVGSAIMDSAEALKMWGGTVNSVAPLFKAFSDNLTKGGLGKQGLTKEVFDSFVQGINHMQLATRALFGMQLPGMAQKGALGAGLEMEAAMEDKTGEGMKKIAKSITETLKGIGGGGGKVLTREEAMRTGQQQQFLQQRGILQQQLGIGDTGTANKIMEGLQAIDKGGMDIGGEQVDMLSNLLTSGQKINEKNQTMQQQSDRLLNESIVSSGYEIEKAIASLGKELGARFGIDVEKYFKEGGETLEDVIAAADKKFDQPEKPKTEFEKRAEQLKSARQQFAGTTQQPAQAKVQQSLPTGMLTMGQIEAKMAYDRQHGGNEKQSDYMNQMMNQGQKVNKLDTGQVIKQQISAAKPGTSAAATGAQSVSKNIDVDVNLKARVQGTSIVIDIAPAVRKAMRDATQNEGMSRG